MADFQNINGENTAMNGERLSWAEVECDPDLRAEFQRVYDAAFTPRTAQHSDTSDSDRGELVGHQ